MFNQEFPEYRVTSFPEARSKILELASGIGWTVLPSDNPWVAESGITAFRRLDANGNPLRVDYQGPSSREECFSVYWPTFGVPVKVESREASGEEIHAFIKKHPDVEVML